MAGDTCGGEEEHVRRKTGWKRPFFPVHFAGVKWRAALAPDRYTTGTPATDKELHSRRQPLRVIIEIRIGSSGDGKRVRAGREGRKRMEKELLAELKALRDNRGEKEEERRGALFGPSFFSSRRGGEASCVHRMVMGLRREGEPWKPRGWKGRMGGRVLYSRWCRRGGEKKSEGGRRRGRRRRRAGDPGFTFWLINGSFFDYRLLCDAYLASLGTISLPFPCVARYSTAREKILGSMTRFLPSSSFSSSSSSSFLAYRGCHRE